MAFEREIEIHVPEGGIVNYVNLKKWARAKNVILNPVDV
jgi:hypothetical protein